MGRSPITCYKWPGRMGSFPNGSQRSPIMCYKRPGRMGSFPNGFRTDPCHLVAMFVCENSSGLDGARPCGCTLCGICVFMTCPGSVQQRFNERTAQASTEKGWWVGGISKKQILSWNSYLSDSDRYEFSLIFALHHTHPHAHTHTHTSK